MKTPTFSRRADSHHPAISFAAAALFASVQAQAGTLPGSGQFVAGAGSLASNGTQMTITQTSTRGVIDWKDFSIGRGDRVDIQNGNGATLNRVTGMNPSFIAGTLSATGSVYLINPQGVVIGTSGVVSTGGRFVASTLDTSNAVFMSGGPLTFTGSSSAKVVNLGKIGSNNSDVFLIARNEVTNIGSVSAPAGTVELAAGQTVLLKDSSTTQQVYVQTGSQGTVQNFGALKAAQVSLQAADGNVYALGGNHAVIRARGTAVRDGHVWLVADSGLVKMTGNIGAKNVDGSGGTVDTVAGAFAASLYGPATVTAGKWNVTASQLRVSAPIGATLLNSLGAGTSIGVNTTRGDLEVATNLGWQTNASLTLASYGSVIVAPGVTIKNQGAGNLTLRADATAIDNQSNVLNYGTLDWTQSAGAVSAYYDMNGTYVPGTLLSNAAWKPTPGSALATQITGYALVNSTDDLANVSQNLAGNYALGRDISVTTSIQNAIGTPDKPFSGQFDGMYHTVDGINIYPQYDADRTALPAGLFGVIGSTGVVRNLIVTGLVWNPAVESNGTTQDGLLAGLNLGHIANTYAVGEVWVSNHAIVGGLVGQNDGLIERSGANVTLKATDSDLGGLVGKNRGTITQSYSTGTVMGGMPPYRTAGLVMVNEGTIGQSFMAGTAWGDWGTHLDPAAIAGVNRGTVTADTYWDIEKSGLTNSGGAPACNGLTTAQMSTPASFVGWDFGPHGAWAMPAGATHPVLRWQLETGNLPPQ